MAVDETLRRSPFVKRNLMELVTAAAPPSPAVEPIPPSPAPHEVADDLEFQPPPKRSEPLPRPGDRYRAHARLNRLSGEQRMIHFVHGDFASDGFSYHDLRRVQLLPADKPGQGPSLVLRFIEASITEVTLSGRNLGDLHHYISEGSMPWVWEQPRGFQTADDHAVVITGIAFCEVEK